MRSVLAIRSNKRPDHVSPEIRSRIMSAIKSKGNKSTELRLKAAFMSLGLCGWKMHIKELPGTPDFIFESKKLAVFVDGCFWHGCPKCYRRPFSSREYWDPKIARNKKNDVVKRKNLRSLHWKVIRIWEHEILASPRECVEKIKSVLET